MRKGLETTKARNGVPQRLHYALTVVLVILVVAMAVGVRSGWLFVAIPASFAVLVLVVQVLIATAFGKRERTLAAHKDWICSVCEYPLDRHSDAGRCPECGTAFTHRRLQAYWLERQARERGERPNPFRAEVSDA